MLLKCTTCTRGRDGSHRELTLMCWCGTLMLCGDSQTHHTQFSCVQAVVFVSHTSSPPHDRTISSSTQVQGGDFNLYENQRCHGLPLVTISHGRLVCEDGVFLCAEGSGRFCPLRPFPDFPYKRIIQREKVTLFVMVVKFSLS